MMKFTALFIFVSLYVAGGAATFCFNCARIVSSGEEYDPRENGFPDAERCPADGYAGAIDCGPFAGCQSRKVYYYVQTEDYEYVSEVTSHTCGPSENKCYVDDEFQRLFEEERAVVEANFPEGHRLLGAQGSVCNCNGGDYCSAANAGDAALRVGRSTVVVLVSSVLLAVSAMKVF